MEPMVKAVELKKRYPGVTALDGVTFTVERGHVVGLLGPNGSGKSTLFRIIAGQSRPDAGEVYVNGKPPGPATKSLVSFVPDYDHLYKWMTVGEIIAFFAAVYPSFRAKQTEETLDFMQLSRRSQVGKLSRGRPA